MKAILFDLDGVFYQGNQPIAGTAEIIKWVKEKNIPHLFVTNTSSRPRSELVTKLAGFGLQTEINHIFTPAIATLSWLNKNHIQQDIALYIPQQTKMDFAEIKEWKSDYTKPSSIVIGDLGFAWNYELMNKIFRQLMTQPVPPLIALGMTRYWQAEDGLRLDIAPFIKALEHASGVKAIVMGKPAQTFFDAAIDQLGINAKDVVMIGDDIVGDIKGAQDSGLKGWLVKTGKFREKDMEMNIKPDKVLTSVAELKENWCAENNA